jgi:hypothetical protein
MWKRERQEFMECINAISPEQVQGWMYEEGFVRKAPKKTTPVSKHEAQVLMRAYNACQDRGLDFESALQEAAKSETAATSLQKIPTKQNGYEKIATLWAEEKSGVPTYRLAHSASYLEIRFREDGTPLIGGKTRDSASKSADMLSLVSTGDKLHAVVVTHKFARVRGAHQDNQRKDAEEFLKFALRAGKIPQLEELAFSLAGEHKNFSWEPAIVVDGEYFEKHIEDMRKDNPGVFIGTTDEYTEYLRELAS